MPIMSCNEDGKPGFKFGENGHCYTYTPGDSASRERARQQAERQGQAMHANQGARQPRSK